jgi:hypothetical protein
LGFYLFIVLCLSASLSAAARLWRTEEEVLTKAGIPNINGAYLMNYPAASLEKY